VKRFGHLKTRLGYEEPHVSIRKTVTTLLENAGVQTNVIDDLLGWKKQGMIGRYSGGSSLAVKRKAIEKLKYPV
jgi:hypothetical protein